MPTTPNLAIPHMAAGDSNKYAEINAAISAFDGAYEGIATVSYLTSTGWQMSGIFLSYMVFVFPVTSYGSAGATVSLPSSARPFIVINQTGAPLTFTVGSGAREVTIPYNDTNPHLLYSDGTNDVYQVS